MSEDVENDDQWLYGENDEANTSDNVDDDKNKEAVVTDANENEQSITEKAAPSKETTDVQSNENNTEEESGKQNEDGSDKEDFEEDSDDDVNVVIGDIKTSPTYTSLNIKRGGLLTSTATGDKPKQLQSGKFTVEEFDQSGTINGVPAVEFNLDSLEDKPWRKPGADITDYFNYGFNEDTWRSYCERQKRLRINESGVGLVPLNAIGMPRGAVPIMNDNSKYSGNYTGPRKAGPPPGRRMMGSIDVIGGIGQRIAGTVGKLEPPKENVIQVMTADRREYSRKPPGFPDMSVPPPNSFEEFQPEYGFNPEPEPFYGGYEPTQDIQWGTDSGAGWTPQELKPLTPGAPPITPAAIPPVNMAPPLAPVSMPVPVPSPVKESTPPHRESRERDRERETSHSRLEKRDRERDRSHRRERSRSRSRRHKSRSRSPSHRPHRKKKSRRHDDSD